MLGQPVATRWGVSRFRNRTVKIETPGEGGVAFTDAGVCGPNRLRACHARPRSGGAQPDNQLSAPAAAVPSISGGFTSVHKGGPRYQRPCSASGTAVLCPSAGRVGDSVGASELCVLHTKAL
jgi:hypothetical protein